jgi:hypothetical protein
VNSPNKQRHLVAVLRPLRDVEGVIGSALWDRAGNLLAHDLPELWGVDLLREVGARIAHLLEAFDSDSRQFGGTTLVFAQHKLQLKPFSTAIVGVLLSSEANAMALQMALTIAGRHLSAEPQARFAGSQRASEPPEAPQTFEGRLYRGQRLPE